MSPLLSKLLNPRLAVSLNPGLKKGRVVKMPVEKFVTWYHDYIVSLFIKEITNGQEKSWAPALPVV